MSFRYLSRAIADDSASDLIPRWTIDALCAAADGRGSLRAARHPLGFTCLPVVRDGHDGVCIHLWDPNLPRAELTTSAIHAHSWKLTSYVLYGELTNERLLISKVTNNAGDQSTEQVYRLLEVRSRGDIDELRPTSHLVRCTNKWVHRYVANSIYTVPAGAFHVTACESNVKAATVALGHMVPGVADLSLADRNAGSHRVVRRKLNQQDTADAARIVIEMIS